MWLAFLLGWTGYVMACHFVENYAVEKSEQAELSALASYGTPHRDFQVKC
jgi:hypothetical protein